jgi:hypothetical protein
MKDHSTGQDSSAIAVPSRFEGQEWATKIQRARSAREIGREARKDKSPSFSGGRAVNGFPE